MSGRLSHTSARTFASLRRHRNYRLYFVGQVVSLSGTWMQNVALAWFVVLLTHGSAVAVGALALCQFGPYAIGGLFGGSLADRLDGRRALIGTQGAMMVTAVALTVLALSGAAQLWEVFVLASLNGAVLILDTPVRQSFTIEMVGRKELPNAIALNASLFNASRVIGPAIAGVLIALVGVGICFLINALSYVAVVAALAVMRDRELFAVDRGGSRPALLRGIGEGLAYAWRDPTVRLVLLMMLSISTISINFNVLMPVLTSQTLHAGPEVFGTISGAFGLGALVGALTSATVSRASLRLLLGGGLAFGVSLLVLAPLHSVWSACVVLMFTGFTFSLYASQSNASLQMAVTDRVRGRVMSLYGYVFFGTAPIGGLLTGWLCGRFGTWVYLLVAGGVAVVTIAAGAASVRAGGFELPRKRRLSASGGDIQALGARE